jgi:hypothetical protein
LIFAKLNRRTSPKSSRPIKPLYSRLHDATAPDLSPTVQPHARSLIRSATKFQPDELSSGDQLVRAKTSRNSDVLRLPTEICFVDAKDTRTNAVLRAINLKDENAFQIPASVTLTRFDERDGTDLIVYEFQVASLSRKCNIETFKPRLPKNTLVADHRFSRGKAIVPPVIHESAMDGWPTEEDAKSKPGFMATQLNWERIQRTSELRRAGGKRSPFWARLAIFLTAVGGIVSIGVLWRRARRRFTS